MVARLFWFDVLYEGKSYHVAGETYFHARQVAIQIHNGSY